MTTIWLILSSPFAFIAGADVAAGALVAGASAIAVGAAAGEGAAVAYAAALAAGAVIGAVACWLPPHAARMASTSVSSSGTEIMFHRMDRFIRSLLSDLLSRCRLQQPIPVALQKYSRRICSWRNGNKIVARSVLYRREERKPAIQ